MNTLDMYTRERAARIKQDEIVREAQAAQRSQDDFVAGLRPQWRRLAVGGAALVALAAWIVIVRAFGLA